MKLDCEVVRDLLPLYADEACSAQSRTLVEEHLRDCPACGDMLQRLRKTELESSLQEEKNTVIGYGARRFRRRSAVAGAVVAGIFMIPILICLLVIIGQGRGLDWFFIVVASLGVAASLSVVPLMVPRDKLFWTFCAFCVSLVLLLAVVCLCTGGSWFWIAASASLFGLSLFFLPFVLKARPARQLVGNGSRWLIVLAVDAALFVAMMRAIFAPGLPALTGVILILGAAAGIGIETSSNGGI